MNSLTNTEISTIRDEVETILDTTATLNITEESISKTGTRTSIITPVDIQCHVSPLGQVSLKIYSEKLVGSTGWVFLVNYDTEVKLKDTILYNDKEYSIIGITSAIPAFYKRIVTKLEG